jgi:hypothetical protein
MGSYFTYLKHSDNKAVSLSTVITASSANSAYPAANLKLLPVAKHWRSTTTSPDLQIDLGASLPINLMGLLNHNLTSSATVTVNGGSSANPNGGQYQTTIAYREFDAFKIIDTAQTWRYWKIIVSDASNADGYIRVGIPVLGNATELGFHWNYGDTFTDSFTTIFRRTPGGAVYKEPVYGIAKETFTFGPITVANMAILRTLYRSLETTGKPIFIIPERDVYDGYFGYFTGEFSRKLDFDEYVTLTFEEDGRGRIIPA